MPPGSLVIQSQDPTRMPHWQRTCLDSVQSWATQRGHDYRFHDNSAFDIVPDWYRDKLAGRTPIIADLARLLLIQQALQSDYQMAAWLDADVLVFDAGRLSIEPPAGATCAFGREYWLSADGARLRVHRNVHNAVCVFRRGCPVLPFLIHATLRIIERVDADHIAPQLVGPKLLGALHNIVGFELLDCVGGASPLVLAELANRPGPALTRLRDLHGGALAALNLCASVNDAAALQAALSGIAHLRSP